MMVKVAMTTDARRANLQSNRHHQQTNIQRPDAIPVAKPTVSKHYILLLLKNSWDM